MTGETYDRFSSREMQPMERVEVRLNGFDDSEWFAGTVTSKARKMQVTLDDHPFGREPFTFVADENSIFDWRPLVNQAVPACFAEGAEPIVVDELPVQPPRGPSLSADDLELLTLAARALGAVQVDPVEGEQWVNLHFADGSVVYAWNSLMYSDDMLDLSVKKGIVIRPFPNHHQGSQVVASILPYVEVREYAADSGHDLAVATRRAVTRAAAEIGNAMA